MIKQKIKKSNPSNDFSESKKLLNKIDLKELLTLKERISNLKYVYARSKIDVLEEILYAVNKNDKELYEMRNYSLSFLKRNIHKLLEINNKLIEIEDLINDVK